MDANQFFGSNTSAKEVIQVRTMFITEDSYGTKRLVVVDENMQQWVVSSRTACSEGAQGVPELIKKEDDWYFKPKEK